MLNRFQYSAILILSALVWAAVLWFGGQELSWAFAQPYGITVAVMTALLVGFDKWFWHWPVFSGWLVTKPHMDGVWEVNLQSNYVDPKTGQRIAAIRGEMTITQTYSGLLVRLKTDKQSSQTIGFDISDSGGGEYEILGIYQSDPEIEHRETSPIHYGTFKLRWDNNKRRNLVGHYWTDRNTAGNFVATNRLPRTKS